MGLSSKVSFEYWLFVDLEIIFTKLGRYYSALSIVCKGHLKVSNSCNDDLETGFQARMPPKHISFLFSQLSFHTSPIHILQARRPARSTWHSVKVPHATHNWNNSSVISNNISFILLWNTIASFFLGQPACLSHWISIRKTCLNVDSSSECLYKEVPPKEVRLHSRATDYPAHLSRGLGAGILQARWLQLGEDRTHVMGKGRPLWLVPAIRCKRGENAERIHTKGTSAPPPSGTGASPEAGSRGETSGSVEGVCGQGNSNQDHGEKWAPSRPINPGPPVS